MALPLSGDSDASYLAAEAVAAAAAPAGAPPSSGTGAVNSLMAGQPKLADNKASTAMDALLDAADPAAAPVHAVVTTEQQLFQRGAALPDAKNVVSSWLPPGPTAVADYPTVLLSGNWLSQEQVGGGQRVRAVHAQAGTTGRAGQGRLPHRRRHPAAERRHQLRAAVGPVVRGRQRDARDVGQRVDGALPRVPR